MTGNSLPTMQLVHLSRDLPFLLLSWNLPPWSITCRFLSLRDPGQVCSAVIYLGRREGVSFTRSQASYFAASTPRGGCCILCLMKLSSNSFCSQPVEGALAASWCTQYPQRKEEALPSGCNTLKTRCLMHPSPPLPSTLPPLPCP